MNDELSKSRGDGHQIKGLNFSQEGHNTSPTNSPQCKNKTHSPHTPHTPHSPDKILTTENSVHTSLTSCTQPTSPHCTKHITPSTPPKSAKQIKPPATPKTPTRKATQEINEPTNKKTRKHDSPTESKTLLKLKRRGDSETAQSPNKRLLWTVSSVCSQGEVTDLAEEGESSLQNSEEPPPTDSASTTAPQQQELLSPTAPTTDVLISSPTRESLETSLQLGSANDSLENTQPADEGLANTQPADEADEGLANTQPADLSEQESKAGIDGTQVQNSPHSSCGAVVSATSEVEAQTPNQDTEGGKRKKKSRRREAEMLQEHTQRFEEFGWGMPDTHTATQPSSSPDTHSHNTDTGKKKRPLTPYKQKTQNSRNKIHTQPIAPPTHKAQ